MNLRSDGPSPDLSTVDDFAGMPADARLGGKPCPHESAIRHVTGAARYVDDLAGPAGLLHGYPVVSPHAHARITRRDGQAALAIPGVHGVFFASDIPGDVRIGPIAHDEAVLAEEEVECVGHPVALIVAETREIARKAAAHVVVEYEILPALLTVEAAIDAGSWHTTPHRIVRGDVTAALASAAVVVTGVVDIPGQDHFYLETHCSMAIPEEGDCVRVISSTQHPSEVQKLVAVALGLGAHQVTCEVPRLGGGFGGKESQASNWAILAALGARALNRPVKVWLDRAQDMSITGKRHPFHATYEAGFAADGTLLALRANLVANGGFSLDLSPAILDRAMFHLDNAYFIADLELEGRVARTHIQSNTAFRGFGGPQGVLVVEDAIERGGRALGLDPTEIRRRSYYSPGRDTTPYGQRVDEPRSPRIHDRLIETSGYIARKSEIDAFNAQPGWSKRGIALQPVKFGISFTNAPLNQAGAYVLMYQDGTVQLNHGGVEMGQGLHTKMLAVCCDLLGVTPARVRVPNTSTEKVPNTSATAASSGTDLNGAAVREACLVLRERLLGVAAGQLGCDASAVYLAGDAAWGPGGKTVPMNVIARMAWFAQIPLSATGFYRTPGIGYDRDAGRGTPFLYYAYGAAVVEVEISGLTGEHRIRRVDILHDVGDSLSPAIDVGQVEGGFVQGYGWLTMEEVLHRPDGSVLTKGPSTYKIPSVGDVPREMRVDLLEDARQPGVIGGSKAVGEPPLILGIGVVSAIRHAIGAFEGGRPEELRLPAHPENVLRAVSSS